MNINNIIIVPDSAYWYNILNRLVADGEDTAAFYFSVLENAREAGNVLMDGGFPVPALTRSDLDASFTWSDTPQGHAYWSRWHTRGVIGLDAVVPAEVTIEFDGVGSMSAEVAPKKRKRLL